MSATSLGRTNWSMSRDKDGYKEYRINFLVVTTDTADGPNSILGASGIPLVGSSWAFGNDSDPYALCWPTASVKPVITKEKDLHWDVELLFTNRPFSTCQTTSITNPLSEPQKVSGSFVNYTKKTEKDRNGKAILSSSLEPIPVERDYDRPTVNIEQNVASLDLSVFSQMINTLNDATLWGLAKRKIKLRHASWSRLVYGTCTYYYQRRFEFDIDFNGFDLSDIADIGTRHLRGKWEKIDGKWRWVVDPDLLGSSTVAAGYSPEDFERITDYNGNLSKPLMLKDGVINEDPIGDPSYIDTVELYAESNFLTLGIPTTF